MGCLSRKKKVEPEPEEEASDWVDSADRTSAELDKVGGRCTSCTQLTPPPERRMVSSTLGTCNVISWIQSFAFPKSKRNLCRYHEERRGELLDTKELEATHKAFSAATAKFGSGGETLSASKLAESHDESRGRAADVQFVQNVEVSCSC
jgi:hypothetical protein